MKKLPWLLVGAALLAFGACSSDALTTAETDVVLTVEDEGRDYSQFKTFLLPDEIVDLCKLVREDGEEWGIGAAGAGGQALVDSQSCFSVEEVHQFDELVLDEVRSQMKALGYVEVEDPEADEPDVAFVMGWVANENWAVGAAYPYCYPYYYYYGCWYPSYTYVYSVPSSALVMDMAVVAESQDGEFVSAWTVALQGLFASSSEASGEERIERAIEQAFEQSPYLAEGGTK